MPPRRDLPPHGARRRGPLGLGTRKLAYFAMMGTCLLLIVLAWTVVRRYSTTAAVAMSVAAVWIPPVAVMIANAGAANRQ